MTDITQLQLPERTLEIIHPGTNQPFGIRVTLMHINDERLAAVKRNILDRRLYLEARGKTFKATEIDENELNILFTGMVGWEWYNPTGVEGDKGFDPSRQPSFEGDEHPSFNRPTVASLMTKVAWFKTQINEAMGELKEFFR